MGRKHRVEIRELDRPEIEQILARNHLGRIAFSFRDRVDIEPISYVYADGWIYGRTSEGEKLSVIGRNWWVAFEVDEVDGPFDWRSAVAHGGFYRVEPLASPQERESWERSVAMLRTVLPETFTPEDPVPFRNVVFRIRVEHVHGRAATSGAPSARRGAGPG
ncbi:MAG: pyridoxamine 5'-phosphate oxidase family protein [Gemmatimonadetes bacterium]|nr:pyridoxamine 5'-phosphate oxidase family protein [Gemmatimonadota bacterium]